MKRWVGRWIIGTSTLHTIFALVVYSEIWLKILNHGVLNTVKDDSRIGAPVNFLLWGLLYFVFGFTIDALEKRGIVPLPKSMGWGLLLNAIIAVVLIPISGYWLLFPPAIAVIISKEK
ncbi:MAG: molecular chaperone GroEL [Desulfobacterales bacterium]|nr:molecular chaperone GroEL [Desulfobacterales bacterium]